MPVKIAIKFDGGTKETSLEFKMNVPKKWLTKPFTVLLEFFNKTYNKKKKPEALFTEAQTYLVLTKGAQSENLYHESVIGESLPESQIRYTIDVRQGTPPEPPKKRQGPSKTKEQRNAERTDGKAECVMRGCGLTYKVSENHDCLCLYHSGRPVFHDIKKYWSCCDGTVVYDWDKFQQIPGCTTGWCWDGNGDNPNSNYEHIPTGEEFRVQQTEDDQKNNAQPISNIDEYNKKQEAAREASGGPKHRYADPWVKQRAKMIEDNMARTDGKAKCIYGGCLKEFELAGPGEHRSASAEICDYHKGRPIFHDTKKFWSCCPKNVAYDWDTFPNLKTCCQGYCWDGIGPDPNEEKNGAADRPEMPWGAFGGPAVKDE